LHLGFTLRVFDVDSGAVVANVPGETMQRFLDSFVWYHQGFEPIGHYRGELYAGDVLTNVLEYTVVTEPVAIPTATPTLEPTLAPVAPPPPLAAPAAPETLAAPPPAEVPRPSTTQAPQVPAPMRAPIPTPEPVQPPPANVLTVAAGPSALTTVSGSDQLYVADRSGLIWSIESAQAVLRRPFSVPGQPVAVAADVAISRMYVVVRDQPAVVTLDSSTGQTLATEPLPANPGDGLFDPKAGQLYVVLPDQDAIETIDVRAGSVVRVTPGLHHVTGMALDTDHRRLYVTQLEGNLSLLDTSSGAITDTLRLTDVGLSGVAIGSQHVYAINAPGRQLIALDTTAMTADFIPLGVEPAAVAVGQNSGTIYLLASDLSAVARLRQDDAEELGAIPLRNSAGPESPSLDADNLWRRPRIVVSSTDETVSVIEPDAALVYSTRAVLDTP
jgi:hypothetical protein